MEDQRNWTDASYKTYSTPLRLPYPVEIQEGDRVWQRVTIEARGGEAAVPATGGPVRVAVDPSRGRTIPPIGLGVGQSRSAARRRGHRSATGAEASTSPSHARSDEVRLAGNIGAGGDRKRQRSTPPWRSKRLPAPRALDCRISPMPCRDRRSTSLGCSSLPTARWSPTRRSSPRRARRSRRPG